MSTDPTPGRALGPRGVLQRALGRRAIYLVPAGVLLAVTLPHLGQGDWRGDTGWYSAIGLNAWRTGKLWSLESQSGVAYFNKPPLAILIHGWFLHVFGVSLAAARVPAVLAAAVSVVSVVGIGRELAGRRVGLWAGIVLALSYEFFRRTREVSLDLWQLAFMLPALWMMVGAVRRSSVRWSLGAGVLLGLALMCKPLMALACVPMAGAWMVVGYPDLRKASGPASRSAGADPDANAPLVRQAGPGRVSSRSRGFVLLAAMAAGAVLAALPWHAAMIRTHGESFTGQYFGAEVVDRAAGVPMGGQAQHKPVWFYAAQIGATYWPWLVVAVLGVAAVRSAARTNTWRRSLVALGLLWFGSWFVLLTAFPDRRDRYALPMYAGLAWVSAVGVAWWARDRWRRAVDAVARWALPVVAGVGAIVAIAPVRLQPAPNPQWTELFAWVKTQPERRVVDGGFSGAPAARYYLETGVWPVAMRGLRGEILGTPNATDLILYHARGGWGPGPGEAVVFHTGDLTVTQLRGEGWNPRPIADPGELR